MVRRPFTHRQYLALDMGLLCAVALIPVLDLVLPQHWHLSGPLTEVFIYALLGLGLNVLTGFTGLLNLGVAAFAALGAYAYAISTCEIYPFQVGFWPGLLVTLVVGAIAGFLLGAPTLRVRGDYLAIVTLGFGEIVKDTLINLDSITKGMQGINPLPAPSIAGYVLGNTGQFYLLLGIVVVAVVAQRALEHSRQGRAWLSIREDELASRAMGIRADRTKMLAFATCAALAALSGGLLASRLSSSGDPSNYDFQVSILALCIVIVGGLGSVRGVLLGAFIMGGLNFVLLPALSRMVGSPTPPSPAELAEATGIDYALTFVKHWANNVLLMPTNWKFILYGVALVLMMIFRPGGLLPPRGIHEELPEETDADGRALA